MNTVLVIKIDTVITTNAIVKLWFARVKENIVEIVWANAGNVYWGACWKIRCIIRCQRMTSLSEIKPHKGLALLLRENCNMYGAALVTIADSNSRVARQRPSLSCGKCVQPPHRAAPRRSGGASSSCCVRHYACGYLPLLLSRDSAIRRFYTNPLARHSDLGFYRFSPTFFFGINCLLDFVQAKLVRGVRDRATRANGFADRTLVGDCTIMNYEISK